MNHSNRKSGTAATDADVMESTQCELPRCIVLPEGIPKLRKGIWERTNGPAECRV
jgi:hypothetical protein